LGYEVQYIYEVWHFKETCEGLFRDYVNTWLKIKQEASGWPAGVETEEEKQAYIQDYHEREGIKLEYDKIDKNPGLRTLAKMMLNSMWGKFGQCLNKTQVQRASRLHHERPNGRSALSTSRGRHPRITQPQHLCGLFHNLLGPTPVV